MDYYQGHVNQGSTDEPKPEPYKPEQDPEALDTEFRRKYPPEPLGREMDDGARVWKVYRDEAMANDATTLDGWSKTLDILLIFAGLFSAVATAFVIESYKSLQLDSGAYTAHALYALLKETSPSSVVSLPQPPPLDASPSALSRWINGLWFTSLVLALAVALLCILVKQWIGEYVARNSASARNARDWARRHQVYFQALSRWPVGQLVSVLPLMLHVSLFLFIAGVAAFLWDLDLGIGIWVIILGTGLTGFYLVCFLLPLWYPEAPTSTPLVHQVRHILATLLILYWRCLGGLLGLVIGSIVTLSANYMSLRVLRHLLVAGEPILRTVRRIVLGTAVPRGSTTISPLSFQQRLRRLRESVGDRAVTLASRRAHLGRPTSLLSQIPALDIDALKWLILSVSDSDAVAVGLQALGARGPYAPWVVGLRLDDRVLRLPIDAYVVSSGAPLHPLEAVRTVRALLCLRAHLPGAHDTPRDMLRDLPEAMNHTMLFSGQPDAALLAAQRAGQLPHMIHIRECAPKWIAVSSPSLTSTVMTVFHSHNISLDNALSVICCVRFSDMSVSDWTLVLQYFRNCPVDRDSYRFSLLHLPPTPTAQEPGDCIGELFCHVVCLFWQAESDFMRTSPYPAHPYDVYAAASLISHIFSTDSFSYDTRISVLPWVLSYVNSQAFLPSRLEQVAPRLDCAISFLSYFEVKVRSTEYWKELLGAYRNVIRACETTGGRELGMQTIVKECYIIISIVLKRPLPYTRGGYDKHITPEFGESGTGPSMNLLRCLLDPGGEGLWRNPWTLWALLYRWNFDGTRWWLADHAAATLCSLSRLSQEERYDYSLFLRPMSVQSLVTALVPSETDFAAGLSWQQKASMQQAVRIASHCVELSIQWWINEIRRFTRRDVSDDMCSRILRLGFEVEGFGTCTLCKGTPRYWEDEDEEGILVRLAMARED